MYIFQADANGAQHAVSLPHLPPPRPPLKKLPNPPTFQPQKKKKKKANRRKNPQWRPCGSHLSNVSSLWVYIYIYTYNYIPYINKN